MSLCLICESVNPPLKWPDKRNPIRLTCSLRCRQTLNNAKKLQDPDYRRRLSESKKGEKNPNWAGDNIISYSALHAWVKRYFNKTELCNRCKKVPPYDLANKGKYIRDLNQWEWLCRKCHMVSDGRLVRLRKEHLRAHGVFLIHKEKRMYIAEWAKYLNIPVGRIYARRYRKLPVDEILSVGLL